MNFGLIYDPKTSRWIWDIKVLVVFVDWRRKTAHHRCHSWALMIPGNREEGQKDLGKAGVYFHFHCGGAQKPWFRLRTLELLFRRPRQNGKRWALFDRFSYPV